MIEYKLDDEATDEAESTDDKSESASDADESEGGDAD